MTAAAYNYNDVHVCSPHVPPLSLPGTFPIDTTKTRLQVQGQQRDALCRHSRYSGMSHALLSITREEGVRALYGGCVWVELQGEGVCGLAVESINCVCMYMYVYLIPCLLLAWMWSG